MVLVHNLSHITVSYGRAHISARPAWFLTGRRLHLKCSLFDFFCLRKYPKKVSNQIAGWENCCSKEMLWAFLSSCLQKQHQVSMLVLSFAGSSW